MKNKTLLILMLALVALQACVKDEEKVFDASAAERTSEAIHNLRNVLIAAPNGWVMEYYPEANRSLGGYHFICKFYVDGTVEVAGELSTTNYPSGKPARSYYDIIANRGAVLTFDTYNEVFHLFSQPSYSDVDGYAGDYEFVLRECKPELIEMTGKKRSNRMEMTPYTGGDASTWKTYLQTFRDMDTKIDAPNYIISIDGAPVDIVNADDDTVKQITRRNRTLRFTYEEEKSNQIIPYITTLTGIKFYEPLTINGKKAQYFTFNETEEKLVATDPGVDMVITPRPLPANEVFVGISELKTVDVARSSSSMQTLVSSAISAIESAAGYGLRYERLYCGRDGGEQMFAFYVSQASSGGYFYLVFNFLFTSVAGTDDAVQFQFRSLNGNAALIPALKTGFIDVITAKSPYRVTVENPRRPTAVTLTSIADPGFYFVLPL
jgi:hypothetical protein